MSQESHSTYEFQPDLPLEGVEAGTNILVSGPSESGAREVALRLVVTGAARNEGLLLVSADVSGRSLLERCESIGTPLDRTRLGIVDCAGAGVDDQQRFSGHLESIQGPGDLNAIGRQLSILYETLAEKDLDGTRIGVFSVSSLLLHAPLRRVSRFVHMLTGRVIATGDLGVFLVDSAAGDRRATETLERFCDRRVTVRREDDGRPAVRVDEIGRAGGLGEWRAFDPPWPVADRE